MQYCQPPISVSVQDDSNFADFGICLHTTMPVADPDFCQGGGVQWMIQGSRICGRKLGCSKYVGEPKAATALEASCNPFLQNGYSQMCFPAFWGHPYTYAFAHTCAWTLATRVKPLLPCTCKFRTSSVLFHTLE